MMHAVFCLSQLLKECPQYGGAFLLHHTGENGGGMAVALTEQIDHASAGTCHIILCTVHHGRYARVDYCSRAHGAGFQSDIQSASVEPPVFPVPACFTDGFHLGVSCGVTAGFAPVASPAYDRAGFIGDHAAYGDFPFRGSLFREKEGLFHEFRIKQEQR